MTSCSDAKYSYQFRSDAGNVGQSGAFLSATDPTNFAAAFAVKSGETVVATAPERT